MNTSYSFAGHIFSIKNVTPFIIERCHDYETDAVAEVEIDAVCEETDLKKLLTTVNISSEMAEFINLHRKVCEYLLNYDIIMFHSSAFALDGKAYIFTAPSGTGKSTHAKLWRERFNDRVIIINDDKPLLAFNDNGIIAHGSPWAGKELLHNNVSFPVGGIVILHQSEKNSISQISSREAFPKFLNQCYLPEDAGNRLKVIDLIKNLSEVPVYELGCTISQDAVDLAYSALTGGNYEIERRICITQNR